MIVYHCSFLSVLVLALRIVIKAKAEAMLGKKEKSSSLGLSITNHCKLMSKTRQVEASKYTSSSRSGACL